MENENTQSRKITDACGQKALGRQTGTARLRNPQDGHGGNEDGQQVRQRRGSEKEKRLKDGGREGE